LHLHNVHNEINCCLIFSNSNDNLQLFLHLINKSETLVDDLEFISLKPNELKVNASRIQYAKCHPRLQSFIFIFIFTDTDTCTCTCTCTLTFSTFSHSFFQCLEWSSQFRFITSERMQVNYYA
jgi:hypothetical protein